MTADSDSTWRAIWALTWRSVVFFPFMLLVFAGVLALGLASLALPFYGALLLCRHEGWMASGCFAFWCLLLSVCHRFRIHEFLQPPPSYL